METQNFYSNEVRPGDPGRNSFAIASFVISLVSIFLSPLIILQILGIVFASFGLKSQKKGLSIAGLVISICSLLMGLVLIVSIVSMTMFGGILNSAKIKADQDMTFKIKDAVVNYINDTKDIELKFGKDTSPSVKDILVKLQGKVTLDGQDYGPYLNISSEEVKEIKPNSSLFKGWDINVDEKTGTIEVKLSKAEGLLTVK